MAPIRRIRNSAAAVLLAAGGLTALAAPAHAAVVPSSCTYSYDLSIPRVAATCYDPTPNGWYLRVGCETPRGKVIYVNGTVVYTAGTGTSIAQCGHGTELGQSTLVNL
jgi:hypothetical protein